MRGRAIGASFLGVVLSVMFAQPASALCIVQPLPRLLRTSDDVWWGTVIAARAAAPHGPGTWELTVRLDDVLKGDGALGDTVTIHTYSCGPVFSPGMADQAAQSFVGEQLLFLVSVDGQHRYVAYGDMVGIPGRKGGASAHQQYNAAIDILGVHGGVAVPIPGTPTDSGDRYDSGTPLVLIFAAVLLCPLILVVVMLRRTSH